MKVQLVITIFFGFFVNPTMAKLNKYVCPTLPSNSGITWHEEHGLDTHLCTAIRTKDSKMLFSVDLGRYGWESSDPKMAHKFKGVIAGYSVLWHFYIYSNTGKTEWESIFSIPVRQEPRPFWIFARLPQNNRHDTREALRLLATMQLVLPKK